MKIALAGKMASGKSSVANDLCVRYGENNCYITSFAAKIKILAKELFNMENKDRFLLQNIATKMREIKSSVWYDYTINECNSLAKNNIKEHFIIDDLRFDDELEALKKDNWKIVFLKISPGLQLKRLKQQYPDTWNTHVENQNHYSEHFVDHWENNPKIDLIINVDKDGSIENIVNKIYNNFDNTSSLCEVAL